MQSLSMVLTLVGEDGETKDTWLDVQGGLFCQFLL